MRPHSAVRCNSLLVKWFLTTFAQRKVHTAHYRPISRFMGIVFYRRSWVLVPIE